MVIGTVAQRRKALQEDADVYVIGRDNVVWLCELLPEWPFDMVVIDELSSFKSNQAKRFKALKKVLPRSRRVVGLTGTPSPNSLMDLWAELYLLDRGERLGKTIGCYREEYFRPGKSDGHVVYSWEPRRGAREKIEKLIGEMEDPAESHRTGFGGDHPAGKQRRKSKREIKKWISTKSTRSAD